MTTRRTSRAPSPGGALHAVSELSTVPCIFYYYYLELPQTLLLPRKNKTGKSTPFHVINSLPAHAGLGVCFLGWAELRRPDATAETPGPRLGERQGAEWGGGSGGRAPHAAGALSGGGRGLAVRVRQPVSAPRASLSLDPLSREPGPPDGVGEAGTPRRHTPARAGHPRTPGKAEVTLVSSPDV